MAGVIRTLKSEMQRNTVIVNSLTPLFLKKSSETIAKNLSKTIALFFELCLNVENFGVSFRNFYIRGVLNKAYDKKNFSTLKHIHLLIGAHVYGTDSIKIPVKGVSSSSIEKSLKKLNLFSAILKTENNYIVVVLQHDDFKIIDHSDRAVNGSLLTDYPETIFEAIKIVSFKKETI